MSYPIQLSLAGDGRLIILTPKTVKKAFFQFAKANPEYTAKEKYNLDRPLRNSVKLNKLVKKREIASDATINDALYRSYLGKKAGCNRVPRNKSLTNNLLYLQPQDIQKVERQLNKYLLEYGFSLVENEGKILTGYNVCRQAGKNRQKVRYIIRYGMFFILEEIDRRAVLKMRNVDLVFQDARTWNFHFVRYYGVLLSSLKSRIEISFACRFNLSQQWNQTVAQFKPRQVFRIISIYPCPGFQILNLP